MRPQGEPRGTFGEEFLKKGYAQALNMDSDLVSYLYLFDNDLLRAIRGFGFVRRGERTREEVSNEA